MSRSTGLHRPSEKQKLSGCQQPELPNDSPQKKRKDFSRTGSDDHPLGALCICRQRFNIEP